MTKQSSKHPAIYIAASDRNGTLYTGVTSNLVQRISEHKNKKNKGFASKYGCTKLFYYEMFDDMETAIAREKQIKGGSRRKKLKLIEDLNPEWLDLFDGIAS